MPAWRKFRPVLRIPGILLVVYIAIGVTVYFCQRSLLFFPTHASSSNALAPWSDGKRTIGYCRDVPKARTIWLMLHGNAGQAADRDYVLPRMSEQDSLYVLEYPGYGLRAGSPSRKSMNQAATQAYRLLRSQHPNTPVCVLGESIGSGPACALAVEKPAPDKIALVVPFDSLMKVAAKRFRFLPIRWMLHDRWDNIESLKRYNGLVEIYGARDDTIIPMEHARALASQIPGAQFTAIPGGHNDWPEAVEVKIQR